MELKHICKATLQMHLTLLIVPYGIETSIENAIAEIERLLIVPYGIETSH